MKLAFYVGTRRPWYIGIGNVLVRLRLRSQISHCELVFEPGDVVDDWMPDASAAPTAKGLWCAGSSATDVIPEWSPRRAGRHGGVRFKRINVRDVDKWHLVDLPWANARAAAEWFWRHQGELYDWRAILGFVAWPIQGRDARWACHEACAAALGHPSPMRTDPAALCETLHWRTT